MLGDGYLEDMLGMILSSSVFDTHSGYSKLFATCIMGCLLDRMTSLQSIWPRCLWEERALAYLGRPPDSNASLT